MPNEYTVLPSASSRFIFALTDNNIHDSIVGVNTKVLNVGKYANKMKMLLLIEFHTDGFYPFAKAEQHELTDKNFPLSELDKILAKQIITELMKSESVEFLVSALDKIFLNLLVYPHKAEIITGMKNRILLSNGNVSMRELSSEFYYSEKHIRRLFLRYIGTTPKTFSRIVRINYALNLLQSENSNLTSVAFQTGFFDQSHFIHDFKAVCGITPCEYIKYMSVFYNDKLKI
jgi:AraC-like DNA-binding protein